MATVNLAILGGLMEGSGTALALEIAASASSAEVEMSAAVSAAAVEMATSEIGPADSFVLPETALRVLERRPPPKFSARVKRAAMASAALVASTLQASAAYAQSLPVSLSDYSLTDMMEPTPSVFTNLQQYPGWLVLSLFLGIMVSGAAFFLGTPILLLHFHEKWKFTKAARNVEKELEQGVAIWSQFHLSEPPTGRTAQIYDRVRAVREEVLAGLESVRERINDSRQKASSVSITKWNFRDARSALFAGSEIEYRGEKVLGSLLPLAQARHRIEEVEPDWERLQGVLSVSNEGGVVAWNTDAFESYRRQFEKEGLPIGWLADHPLMHVEARWPFLDSLRRQDPLAYLERLELLRAEHEKWDGRFNVLFLRMENAKARANEISLRAIIAKAKSLEEFLLELNRALHAKDYLREITGEMERERDAFSDFQERLARLSALFPARTLNRIWDGRGRIQHRLRDADSTLKRAREQLAHELFGSAHRLTNQADVILRQVKRMRELEERDLNHLELAHLRYREALLRMEDNRNHWMLRLEKPEETLAEGDRLADELVYNNGKPFEERTAAVERVLVLWNRAATPPP